MRKVIGFIVLVTIVGFLLFNSCINVISNAHAQSYLGSSGHCDGATVEPYVDFNFDSGTDQSASGYSDYPPGMNQRESDGIRTGVRFRIPLASTCTKEYREAFIRNEELKQQLEMLKVCARYRELELGENFAEVREMGKGVRAKEIAGMTQQERDELNRKGESDE